MEDFEDKCSLWRIMSNICIAKQILRFCEVKSSALCRGISHFQTDDKIQEDKKYSVWFDYISWLSETHSEVLY